MPIIPIDKIPAKDEIQDTPLDNLMKIYKVCLDMEIICKKEGGIGLSAVQIGIPWKLFIVRYFPESKSEYFKYYVNCDYVPLVDVNQKHMQSVEGCLSLRKLDGSSRQFLVERYPKIKVRGKLLIVEDKSTLIDLDMNLDNPNDIYTIVLQHECDHNFGTERLISNIGQEIELTKVSKKT